MAHDYESIPVERNCVSMDEFCRLALEHGLFVRRDDGVIVGPHPFSTAAMQRVTAYLHSDKTTTRVS
jgi:hypothetical protein